MQNLFAYGSLMCEDIMSAVAGESLACAPALLHRHRRLSVMNEYYPGIVPDDGGTVQGIVYRDISPSAWARLDRFEGEMYVRSLVAVSCRDSVDGQVYCYIVKPEYRHCLTAEKWDFATFLRTGKKRFVDRYPGFSIVEEG